MLAQRRSPTDRVAPRPVAPGYLGARTVFQASPGSGAVALTFDDGPGEFTPLVLDLLGEAGIPATFFLLGTSACAHPDLVAREAGAGHEVAVHGWDHQDVYSKEYDQLGDEIDRTMSAITSAGAPAPRLWRPPYGRVDAPALMVAASRGLDVVLWGHHTPDVATAQGLVGSVGAGGIILSHDARSQPTEALVRAVVAAAAAVRDQGLALVTVSELLRLDAAASS